MTQRMRLIHVVLVGLLTTVSPPPAALSRVQDSPAATGSISGVVTIEGRSAPDVGVILFRVYSGNAEAPAVGRVRSYVDGSFRFEGLVPGKYAVDAYSPGLFVFDKTDEEGAVEVSVGEGEAVKDVAIALEKGCAITGKLVDEDGRPIVSQSVDVYARTAPGKFEQRPSWRSVGVSDDRGVYRVYGLPPGTYVVGAGREVNLNDIDIDLKVHFDRCFFGGSKKPEDAKLVDVAAGGEAQGVDIVLKPSHAGFALRGRVVDAETNLPLPHDLWVHFGPWEDGMPEALRRSEKASQKGEFRLKHLAPGTYGVQASLSRRDEGSFVCDPVQVHVVDSDVTDVVIRMKPAATVRGVIAAAESESGLDLSVFVGSPPIFLVSVDTTRPWWSATDAVTAWLDVRLDGTFTVTGVRPGSYRAIVNHSFAKGHYVVRIEKDGAPVIGYLRVEKAETIGNVRIVVARARGAVRGRVVCRNGAVDFARVAAVGFERGAEQPRLWCPVDAAGGFVLEGFPPGDTVLQALYYLETGAPVLSNPVVVAVPADGAIDITLELDLGNPPGGGGAQ